MLLPLDDMLIFRLLWELPLCIWIRLQGYVSLYTVKDLHYSNCVKSHPLPKVFAHLRIAQDLIARSVLHFQNNIKSLMLHLA